MRILVTRPEPDAGKQAAELAARGHAPIVAPLLIVEPYPDVPLELDGADALIVTSRNALRALASHPDKEQALQLPLFAVGDATAFAAQQLGFTDVTSGPGTGHGLAEVIEDAVPPERRRLVHLAGEKRAFDLKSALEPKGFEVRLVVLYRAGPSTALPPDAVRSLQDGALDAVILMSPRTARIFAELAASHGLVTQASRLVCYCISQAVADAAAPLGAATRIAREPSEEDVLALLDAEAASS